jgi:ATP-dependent Lhr-like helicase
MGAFSRFDPLLQDKIANKLGWSGLRPVQELAADAILDGANCIVLAPTAGGKTEAAMFPVLSGLLTNQQTGLRALYICPTRALLNNQEERIQSYASMLGFDAFKWHGDITAAAKKNFIKETSEILLTTPESLEVMLISGNVPTAKLFKNLKYVVIDEIHALAACDRGNHLISVLERIRAYTQNDFQRIGLSATVGNPEQILNWLQGSSKNQNRLIDPPKTPAKKMIEIQWVGEPGALQMLAVNAARGIKSLLFCESRRLAEKIAGGLKKTGEPVYVHHSSLSREEREETEKQFHHSKEACIVCTSTMELGIDVGDLDKVLQVNVPATVSSFLQRMGRTGRRTGTTANTTFFIEKDSYLLQTIAIVELARNHWVEKVKTHKKVWHILLHQIMAMCLERGAVTTDTLWRQLHQAWCFSEITQEKFYQFVGFLKTKEFLHDDGGVFSIGLEAEKVFGRRNFMEIYSVFSTPTEFEVIGLSGDVIGTIEWEFLEKLLEDNAAFYLAGTAWSVERIEWNKKRVMVTQATGGKVPKWGGLTPSFLGYTLCRKMRDILACNDEYAYLTPAANNRLKAMREDSSELLQSDFAPIEQDDKGLRWWTWAGGYINNTLRVILKIELDTEVQATNEFVRIKSEEVTITQLNSAIQTISQNAYWENPVLLKKIISLMPDYRLSKFQPYLPEELSLRLVADTILDIEGTVEFLRGCGNG